LFFDVASRTFIGEAALKDVCGVAPSHRGEGFLLTTGMGQIAFRDPAHSADPLQPHSLDGIAFDNHAIMLS
jgi:uncharacterized protein